MTLSNNAEIQKRMEQINQQIEPLNEVPQHILDEVSELKKLQTTPEPQGWDM